MITYFFKKMNSLKILANCVLLLMFSSCHRADDKTDTKNKASLLFCSGKCEAKNASTGLSCKLTTKELQQRRETVLASLKKQMLEKKELKNGYAFKFSGSDALLDELTSFIKTERVCCDFFIFNISVSGDKGEAWLEITGPDGVKDFITSEFI
jgi:hypothetical protein